MSWTRGEVTLLLEEYRKWPNLFKIKSANYKNRNLRRVALDSVLAALKELKPEVTTQELQTKFQSLKQTASKERKKIADSHRSGAGLDDIVESSLWYYKIMSYVFDDAEPRPAIDSLDDASQEETQDDVLYENNTETEEGELLVIEVAEDMELTSPLGSRPQSRHSEQGPSRATSAATSVVTPSSTSVTNLSNAPTPRGKRKRDASDTLILGQVSSALSSISKQVGSNSVQQVEKKTTNQIFGEYVASKLDQITIADIRDEVEADIINALNCGLRQCRNRNQ